MNSEITTPSRSTRTRTAAPSANRRKPLSENFSRASARARSIGELRAALGVWSVVAVIVDFNFAHFPGNSAAGTPAPLPDPSFLLDVLIPHCLDQLDDVVRHRDIVEVLRHLAALLVCPLEELEGVVRGGDVDRLLVHED